jgi:flagellar hook-basal body complex protein FliE
MSITLPLPPTPEGIPPISVTQPPLLGMSVNSAATSRVSFPELLERNVRETAQLLEKSEKMGKEAALGAIDPQVVATSVVRARSALHQLTTLLSALTQAYQEVMRFAV